MVPSGILQVYFVFLQAFKTSLLRFFRRTGIKHVTPVATIGIALVFSGCGAKADTKAGPGKGSGAGAIPVVVDKVQKKTLPLTIDGIGAVESLRAIAIKSLVTGSLWKVNFREGQEVKQGDLLFEIDPRPFKNALSSSEADLEKTQAQLETAESEVVRYSALLAQSMVSKEQFQTIQNNHRSLKAQLLSNQAAVANAKLQLEYCSISAPCDGRTGSLGAHEGDLVRASDANISLVTITQLAPIYVTFSIPQQNLADLQYYTTAGKITVAANLNRTGDAKEDGELNFIDNAIDSTTGTIKLKAIFGNAKRGLWPGQFVSIKMTLATIPDQIVVPATAVQNGQRGPQAFIVRQNNTVELRNITVGRSIGMETIITKGLAEGETVVVDGQLRLRPDAQVEIKAPVADVPSIKGGDKSSKKSTALTQGETPGGIKVTGKKLEAIP